MRRRRLPSVPTCLILLVALLLGVGIARAPTSNTIHVDCTNTSGIEDGTQAHPFDTVQEGIDAAVDGDTVLVYPCTYYENIDFLGKAITVTSPGPLDPAVVADTVIDGGDAGSVVTFANGEGAGSVLTGFTITNGTHVSGGGVQCDHTSPTIASNSIIGNIGAGLHCHRGSPVIVGNSISDNSVGISCYWHCLPTIEGNSITDNNGHGIYAWGSELIISGNLINRNAGSGIACVGGDLPYASSAAITGNTISENTADACGGGISVNGLTRLTIANNLISRNLAGEWGGGVCVVRLEPETWPPTIANNVIHANSAMLGGGISCEGSSALIANNTIVCNIAKTGGGIDYGYRSPELVNNIVAFCSSGIAGHELGTPVLRNNCVYGNTAYDYSVVPDPTGTNGNISVDPRLAARAFGNLHIQPDSPCRDAGDDTVVALDWVDMDGQARIQGATVDIGADESDGTSWPMTARIVRVRTDGDDSNDGSTWALAKRTVGAAIGAAAETGGEVWVSAGVYLECIELPPCVYLYGGFDGSEELRSQRDWAANTTVLDGGESGSVVTARGCGHFLTSVDGFTIRNGRALCGGGISCEGSSLPIVNNAIIGNAVPDDDHHARGGGVYCLLSSPIITGNSFQHNSGYYGGGVYCEASSAVISDNSFEQNSGRIGGGLYCKGWSPFIAENTFTGNTAKNGAAICSVDTASVEIISNEMAGNTADNGGGGLWVDGPGRVTENSIVGNSAETGGGITCTSTATVAGNVITGNAARIEGGGIACLSSEPVIEDNVISDNTADEGGGVYVNWSGPVLDGNTITRNTAVIGGGICCEHTPYDRPTIRENTVSHNRASDRGGGIYLWKCSAIVADNMIAGNDGPRYGGGIFCAWCSPDIISNTITGNVSRWGGGISCLTEGAQPKIASNIISLNQATERGGGIDCYDSSSPDIAGNIISANTATYGGGVGCQMYSSPSLANNVIAANDAGRGGGIFLDDHCSPAITNCTIADNTATSSGDGITCFAGSWPMVCNSIVWNQIFALPPTSITVTYSDTLDCWPGVGNICLPPEFVDPANGDYHLLPTSPCIDMGTNGTDTCVPPPDDIDGQPRPWSLWGVVDMGADEVVPPPACDITYAPASPTTDDVIIFNSGASDPNSTVISWDWDFGDGGAASGDAVAHQYLMPGSYTVTVRVCNTLAACATCAIRLTVTLPCECNVAIDRMHCKMPAAGHIGQCKTGQIGARNMSYTESCEVVMRVIDNAGTVIFETTRTLGPGRRLRVRFDHCYTADEVGKNLWTWEVSPVECNEVTPWNNVHLRRVNVQPGERASVGDWLPLWRLWRR